MLQALRNGVKSSIERVNLADMLVTGLELWSKNCIDKRDFNENLLIDP